MLKIYSLVQNAIRKSIVVYISIIFFIGAFIQLGCTSPSDPWFGFNTTWTTSQTLDNVIRGSIGTPTNSGTANSISVYLKKSSGTSGTWNINCSIYYASNNTFFATTTGQSIALTTSWTWYTFNFPSPKPSITAGTSYYIFAFANDAAGTTSAQIAIGSSSGNKHYYKTGQTYPLWPTTITGLSSTNNYATSIYCSYTVSTMNNPPIISGNIPLNGSTGIPLHPTVNVTITDLKSNTSHCDWYTSTNGVDWTWRKSNNIVNGSISYDYTGASSYNTVYYWKVSANDGMFNVSNFYYFKTQSQSMPLNWFGFNTTWTTSQTLDNVIRGSIGTPTNSGTANSISAYLKKSSGTSGIWSINCSLYYASNNTLFAATTGKNIALTTSWTWYTFDFADPKPSITAGTSYYIFAFANDAAGTTSAQIAIGSSSGNKHYYKTGQTYPLWPTTITGLSSTNNYATSIYCSYTVSSTNNPPIISSPNPSNGAINVPITTSQLTFSLNDPEGDLMNYNVQTSPSIGSKSENNVGNGTKTITITNLQYSKIYYWFVNATDPSGSNGWTKKTYSFTTINNNNHAPVVSNVYPNNINAPYNPRLTIKVYDSDNDPLTVIFRTNANGPWITLGTQYGGNKVYTQDPTGMDIKNKKYYWSANISDGKVWVNNTYFFTAQAFVLKWSNNINIDTTKTLLAADVDHDGIYEVFAIGNNSIWCLNGSTGAIRWKYDNSAFLGYDSQMEIGDLNNDGIPELVASAHARTIALHANNGTEYWNVRAESSNKNIVIADIEGNGYPYVYIASDNITQGDNGTGRIRKLRGTDGTVLAECFAFRPCYGSLSFADADNDGNFELYSTDRSYSMGHGSGAGRGMICYDAETLRTLWYCDKITCSSHCQILADVNNDGILDSIAVCEVVDNGGIFVIDGKTWDKMPGKWALNFPLGTNLTAHSQPTVYDIDGDGNLELITCSNATPKIWDLGSWSLENINPPLINASEPPSVGNVIGDGKLEIIDALNKVYIYNQSYKLVETINTKASAHVLVQDLDNNGRNELVLISQGTIKAYDTSGVAPAKLPRTNSEYYSERRTNAAVYIPPPGAPQPIVKETNPKNNSQDIQLNPILSARVVDFHYDRMNIKISTNASGSWVDVKTFNNVGNGWYNYTSTNMNQPKTTYYWRVTAVDPNGDNMTTIVTYRFTTNTPPVINNIVATPNVISSGQYVNISCNVTDNNMVNNVKVNIKSPDGGTINVTALGSQPKWKLLTYDDFESGWGNYTSGGINCLRYTGTTYSHNGNHAIDIRNYTDVSSSCILTNSIDVDTPRYTSIKVDFWFKAQKLEPRENFWVKYYDGTHWQLVGDYLAKRDFSNETFYHKTIWINETNFTFPKNMKIRFQCDATSDNTHNVYIDQVYIYAKRAQEPNYYYNNIYTQKGTYNYFIWANDLNGNSITSDTHTFSVQ